MIISFGGSEREKVQIEVQGYQHQPTGEYYDNNWLSVQISILAGSFRGKIDASFLTVDFASFLPQLRLLHKTLQGCVEFMTMEEQLYLKLVGDGKGHIELEGELRDRPGVGNRLNFTLQFDQTQLKESISQLEQIVSAFPIRQV